MVSLKVVAPAQCGLYVRLQQTAGMKDFLSAQVMCCTAVGSHWSGLEHMLFPGVLFDEAAVAHEGDTLAAVFGGIEMVGRK